MRLNLCVKLHATLKPKHKPKFVRIANSEIILPNFVYQAAHWCKYHDIACLSKQEKEHLKSEVKSWSTSTRALETLFLHS